MPPQPASQIVAITVACGDPRNPVLIDLAAMVRHCRPERVEELVEDLEFLCDEVLARRRPEDSPLRPGFAVIQGGAR